MKLTLHINGKPVDLENIEQGAGAISFALAGKSYKFFSRSTPGGSILFERELSNGVKQSIRASSWQAGKERRVRLGALEARISESAAAAATGAGENALSPVAPMPGLIRKIFVKAGDNVTEGQALLVMEAMKLQVTLSAGGNAKVEKLLVKEGELVTDGAELVKLIPRTQGKAK